MATTHNFFAILGDDENEDFEAIATRIAVPVEKAPVAPPPKPAATVAPKESTNCVYYSFSLCLPEYFGHIPFAFSNSDVKALAILTNATSYF